MLDPDDQLYINAHCCKGIDYLANKENPSEGDKVTTEQLIQQLRQHGLSETTKAKIKLFVCEGALDNGLQESFAKHFSRALHAAGFHDCHVYAYTESVAANLAVADDGQYHKAAHGKSRRLRNYRQKFFNGKLVPEG